MSDTGRKDFSDKAAEAIKPDSQKSYAEQGKEFVTDKTDKVAGKLQPEQNKGAGQGVADAFQQGKDDAKADHGKTLSETAGEYIDAAKGKLNDAAEYVSASLNGAKESADNTANDINRK